MKEKILFKLIYLTFPCLILASCSGSSSNKTKLILTEAPGSITLSPDYLSGVSWRYLPGARISEFTLNKPGSARILTKDFYSACFPDISYDGKSMIFAGQLSKGDIWQIWEMKLGNGKYRQITSSKEDCTDPSYLPGGRFTFSKHTINDTVRNSHCLYTCSLNGSDLKQITFSPQSHFASTILKDGRILTIVTQTFPEKGDPVLMVMRPDGTKADVFYKNISGQSGFLNSACETDDGRIIFVESGKNGLTGGNLVSIEYSRPLFTRKELSTGSDGDFLYALPLADNDFLVSFRKKGSDLFGLYDFNVSESSVGREVFKNPGYNIIDVAVAGAYNRPKKLPSEVDLMVKTGLILCQDVNFQEHLFSHGNTSKVKADRIEVLGVDSTYGVVKVEKDGSFYLKVMADKPFRIRALDEKGNPVGPACSWLWLRPNERRGCVGCHEDPEFAPENRVSFAIRKDPVIIPVHITEIKEKIVELE
jgi:hypothetical protein